jgi:hypothetical protein
MNQLDPIRSSTPLIYPTHSVSVKPERQTSISTLKFVNGTKDVFGDLIQCKHQDFSIGSPWRDIGSFEELQCVRAKHDANYTVADPQPDVSWTPTIGNRRAARPGRGDFMSVNSSGVQDS